MAGKWIYKLNELRSDSNELVGRKCANLGEMVHYGLRVPPGFAISVDGYERFMKETGAGDEIRQFVKENIEKLESNLDIQIKIGLFIRGLILSKEMPEAMKNELCEHYDNLCSETSTENLPVATRSSGAISMPGQMDTYLNVRGRENVVKKVIEVWASAFTTRAIAFRVEKKMEIEHAPIGVAVLKMIDAKSAGVTLTVHPSTGNQSKVVVEGNWGLGESVVSGDITPDSFIVDKESGKIDQIISKKPHMVVYTDTGTAMVAVPEDQQELPCLQEDELREIVHIAKKIESYFQTPQDMEWVVEKGSLFPENIYWVQTRPAKFVAQNDDNSEYLAELMTRCFSR